MNELPCNLNLPDKANETIEWQRQVIEQLRRDLELLKADDAERCILIRDMEEEERRKDAVIEHLERQNAALREALKTWQSLFRQAVSTANGLTNYVEDRPELHHAERRLALLEQQALKERP